MHIEFIAHATFKITLKDGRTILVDPYQGMAFQGRFNYPSYATEADFVLMTHEHIDHNYLGDMRNIPVVVRHQWQDFGLVVSSIFAWHDKFEGTRFGGGVRMKVIEADGIRIAHLGDVGERLSDAQIAALGKIDVLLLPVGGFYTLDGDDAADLAKRIGARTTIPCHYKTSLCTLPIEEPARFLQHFEDIVYWQQNHAEVDALPAGVVVMPDKWHAE